MLQDDKITFIWDKDGLTEYLCWIPIAELEPMKAFPIFFKDKLLKSPEELEHINCEKSHDDYIELQNSYEDINSA